MKKIRLEDAVGMELCHDITAMRDGFKGAAFRRGHVIREEDIPELLDLGKRMVYVWEKNAGEIHEEDAALRMAAMAPVGGAHYTDLRGKNCDIAAALDKHIACRYLVYFLLITAILLFGSYGPGYDPQEFVYFQF